MTKLDLDTSLPFFVYDIYNPSIDKLDEIFNIESITNDDLIEKIIPIKIKHYSGMPKQGYLIYFNDEYCDKAYEIISKYQLRYSKWKEHEIDGKTFNVLINKNNRYEENNFLKLPNINLPFFAYGVFKKGQIGYSRIKDYIKKEETFDVNYRMGIRDGIPILLENNQSRKTNGYLIEFNENDRKKAYKIISSKANKLYKWKEIDIGDNNFVNVLMGEKIEKGTSDMNYEYSYDGLKDYFFIDAINLIENDLEIYNNDARTIENFFYLQMNYLLLWVAIERFCILKYGLNEPYINRANFAGQNKFQECLNDIERDKESIYSAKDFNIHYLNKDNPYESIEYYYTIRCNVAHRGKTPACVDFDSYDLIYDSLEELLNIFKEVLIDSFGMDIFQKEGGILKKS